MQGGDLLSYKILASASVFISERSFTLRGHGIKGIIGGSKSKDILKPFPLQVKRE